jgi:hypothetical protein
MPSWHPAFAYSGCAYYECLTVRIEFTVPRLRLTALPSRKLPTPLFHTEAIALNRSTDKKRDDSSPDVIGPVQQFQLLLYATKDTELTACDLAVLAELTDRYLKDKGVTRPTSAAHLERETGRDDSSTQRSLARLLERGYITIAEPGHGRRGHTYLLPFDWVKATATAIYNYIKPLSDAKRRRRRGRRSYRTDAVDSTSTVATAPTRLLRSFVTAPMRYLTTVATASTRDQSYGLPMVRPIGADMSAGTDRVPPPVVTKRIKSVSIDYVIEGERCLFVNFDVGPPDIMVLESSYSSIDQEAGQERYSRLTSSAGLGWPEYVEELVGCTVYTQGNHYLMPHDVANDNNDKAA